MTTTAALPTLPRTTAGAAPAGRPTGRPLVRPTGTGWPTAAPFDQVTPMAAPPTEAAAPRHRVAVGSGRRRAAGSSIPVPYRVVHHPGTAGGSSVPVPYRVVHQPGTAGGSSVPLPYRVVHQPGTAGRSSVPVPYRVVHHPGTAGGSSIPAPHRVVHHPGTAGGSLVPAPYRVVHDAGAGLVRRSPHPKRTVTRGTYPPITVRPAPAFEPPYVDDPGADEWYREAAGQLAFDFAALTRRTDQAARADPPAETPAAPRPAPSPEARRAASRFARTCLEILNGYRPVAHVRSLSQPAIAQTLIDQLLDALRRLPGPPAIPRRQPRPELVKLRRLRISEPTPGVVEAAAALGTDARTWAMAFRLEHTSTTWLGTVLQVI